MQIQRLEKKSISSNAWNICKQSHLSETGPKLQEGICLLEAQDKNTVYKPLESSGLQKARQFPPMIFYA